MKPRAAFSFVHRALAAAFCLATVLSPENLRACAGSAGIICLLNPGVCTKSMSMAKAVTNVVVANPGAPANLTVPIIVYLTCPTTNHCGGVCTNSGGPVSASLAVNLYPGPCSSPPMLPPTASGRISTAGGTMALPTCAPPGSGFNTNAVPVTLPAGTRPGVYCVIGTVTVTFADGTVLTQTGDTVVCVVDPVSGQPGVPRLNIELLSAPFPRMAPGDQHVAAYRVTNNDPSNSVSLTAFANSRQSAVRPQGGNERQGVFTISSPFGDDFPIMFIPGTNSVPLPSHPYTQPEISTSVPVILPGQSRLVTVGVRSYGQCASGSCSESTLRVQGSFSDNTPALACAGFSFFVDTAVSSQSLGRQVNDCNNNGIPDALDIERRLSQDRNFNAMPDECEEIISVPTTSSVTPTNPSPSAPIQVRVAFNEVVAMSSVWANGSPLTRTQQFGFPFWIGTIPADTRPGPQTVYFLGKDLQGGLATFIATYTVQTSCTPPSVTNQPQSQTVCAGGGATFCVGATGSASLNYQWFHDGAPVAGATSPCFVLASVAPIDAGTYRVTITNACGSTNSQTATLTVNTPPAILCPTNPILATVPCGSNCVPVNYPLPTVLNGTLIGCNPPSGSCFQPGANTVTCTATNACGQVQCSFTVLVSPAPLPVVINCPTNPILATVPCGSNCVPVNYPPPTVLNGTLIGCNPPSGSCFQPGTNFVTCTASNACGITNCIFTVIVHGAGPRIFGGLTNLPLGGACAQVVSNQLVLSSIGSSGQDGVSIDLGAAQFGSVLFECTDPIGPPTGASLAFRAIGGLNGTNNQLIAEFKATDVGNDVFYSWTIPALGEVPLLAMLYDSNNLVATAHMPTGLVHFASVTGEAGDARSTPYMPLHGRPAMVLEFAERPTVTLTGGQPIAATRIVVVADVTKVPFPDNEMDVAYVATHEGLDFSWKTAESPTGPLRHAFIGPISAIEVLARHVPEVIILDEQLGMFGLAHHALGGTQLRAEADASQLTVLADAFDNGSVDIIAGGNEGGVGTGEFEVVIPMLIPPGAFLRAGIIGPMFGSSNEMQASLEIRQIAPAALTATPRASSNGFQRVEVLSNGVEVASAFVSNTVAATFSQWPKKFSMIPTAPLALQNPPWHELHLSYSWISNITFNLTGVGSVSGNELRVGYLNDELDPQPDTLKGLGLRFGGGLSELHIIRESTAPSGFYFQGLAHQSISNASLHLVGTDLVISNSANAASFGASVILGDAAGGTITLGGLELPSVPEGSTVEIRSHGTVNGVPDQAIGTLRLLKLAAGLRTSVDHTPLGVSGATAVILDGSTVVGATEDFLSTDFPPVQVIQIVAEPIWNGSGGIEEEIRFGDRQPVSLNGGPPVLGDRIVITPNPNQIAPLVNPVSTVSRLEVVGAGLNVFRIASEELGMFHRGHQAIGQARVLAVGDGLRVDSLAAWPSGPGGIRIPLDKADTFSVWWRTLDPFNQAPQGTLVRIGGNGAFIGGQDQPLDSSQITLIGATKEITSECVALGALSRRVEVYRNAELVFTTSLAGNTGVVAQVRDWPAGAGKMIVGPGGPLADVYWRWVPATQFTINNQLIDGDELRILAENVPVLDHLSSFTLQASGFSEINLVADIAQTLAPVIIQSPASQTVPAGSTVTFSVVATGKGPLAYQWLHNGQPLAGETNATLILGNVQASDVGEYIVFVTNLYGTMESEFAMLTVVPPLCVSITCPTNIIVDCTHATLGTAVNYGVIASNACFPGNAVATYCVPPTGTRFPPGTWTVDCYATSAVGAGIETNHCSFLVTVRSNCPPVACVTLRCPTNLIVSCQGSFGATVNYTVEAANQCSPNSLQVQCEPPSGSVFPVGTTRVLCVASVLGESVICDFTVTVVPDGANCTTNDPVRHAISGRALTRAGAPIPYARVSLGGAAVQETWTATDGSYGFFNLLPDVAYAVGVAKSNHIFAPTVRQIGSLSNSMVMNFTGTTPFEQWRESRWGSNPPPALAAPTADPDGDRKPNIVEYVLGTDPQAFDLDPGFSITMVNGANGPVAELQIRLKPEVTDVQITLEGAANLGDWDAFGRYVPEGLPGSSLLPWYWLGDGDIVPLGGSVRLCLPLGLCITLPPVTEIPRSFWRWSICLLTDCDEGGGIPVEPLPPTNESLRVGTYNVQFLPQLPIPELTSGCCEAIPDRTFKMAERIAATGVDVIGINEMFVEGGGCESARFLARLLYGDDYEAVIAALPRPDPRDAGRGPMTFEEWCHKMNAATGRRDLVELMRARNYRHIVAKLDARGSLLQDSGLMLFSKFPFVPLTGSGVDATAAARYFPEPEHLEAESPGTPAPYVAFVPFDASVGCAALGICPACHGSDCLSNKGAGLVRIRNPYSGRTYLVVFSHFNASDSPGDRRARAAQFAMIREMIETFRAGRLDEHVIVMGDLNVIGNFDKPEHFPPLVGESCPERGEWWCHFGAGGDYFSATMHDAWEQQMQLAMPEIFNDRRASGGTSRGGGERLDYVLVNQPESPFDNAPLCVQHIAVAHGLAYSDPTLDQGYTPAAFGEAGEVDLSDHFGIIADINLEAPHCSPPSALNAYPRLPVDGTDTAADFPASLVNRGQMYWLSVTNPGTYSFALRGTGRDASGALDTNFAYQVYRIDDLSRPLSGLAGRTRTLNVPGVSNLTAQVFASQDLPLLIRVWHTNRTATGSFNFYARHHLGGSHDDAIEIASPNNPYPARVDFPAGVTGAPERWFRFDTDRADSGADQLLHGYASSEDGASVGELLLLAADHATVLDGDAVLSATATLDVRHPYGGGTSLYLLLRPAAPVAGRAFRVGWDTDLTVLSPGTNGCGVGMFLKCIAQNDRPDVLGEDDDDMVLRIFRDSDLDGTRTLIRGPRPLRCEWDTGHEEPVGHIVRTIRFVPGERIVMQLIENDDFNFGTCGPIWSRPGSFDLVDTGDGDCEEGKGGCDFEFLEVVIGHLPTSVWRRCGRADADCDPARTPPCAWPYSLGEVRCPDSCTGHYEFHCRVSHGGQ